MFEIIFSVLGRVDRVLPEPAVAPGSARGGKQQTAGENGLVDTVKEPVEVSRRYRKASRKILCEDRRPLRRPLEASKAATTPPGVILFKASDAPRLAHGEQALVVVPGLAGPTHNSAGL